MPERTVNQHIALLQERINALQQRVTAAPGQAAAVLPEALEELRTALEELHVADEELRRQNDALAAARRTAEAERQRYQELFEQAPDGYLVTDPAGVIQEANQAAAVLLDRAPEFLVGKPLALFVVEPGRRAFRTLLHRLPRLERVQDWDIDMRPTERPSFPAALTVVAMHDCQGRVNGLRWLLRDVTLRKQAEAALRQAQETLEQRVAERTAALQQVNARLRLESAERQGAVEQAQQAAQALRQSHEQLRQLATSLQHAQEQERSRIARELHDDLAQMLTSLRLDVAWLSRHTATAPAAWRARLDAIATDIAALGEAVRRIGTELRPTVLDNLGLSAALECHLKDVCARTGLTYALQVPRQELTLGPARSTAMFRIFQEAVTNVVRHAQASHVSVHLLQQSDAWLLEVSDDGRGITSAQRTHPTALGLLGMRERAHLWGGEVAVLGQSGVGTTVSISLPCESLSPGLPSGTSRVLVVDDHATVRVGIKRFIAETPDLVVAGEASTAQEMFAALAVAAYDVVLLDLSLPGRDGLDVLQQLQHSHPTVPVLVFSVHTEEQYAIRALKTGAAGYLTKDCEPEVLLLALRRVAQGGRYVSPALAERLALELMTPTGHPPHATLANREYQVLLLLAAGKTVKEIADTFALSVKTVSTYRTRLLKKLHLKTTADLIHYAVAERLLSHQPSPLSARIIL